MVIIRTGLLLLFLATPSFADTASDLISTCASILPDAERLICFDAIAKGAEGDGPAIAPTPAVLIGKWQVDRTKNPVDDSETVIATLVADSGASSFGQPVILLVRCQSKTTEVFISWNDYLATDGDFNSGYKNVLTRVGTEPASTSHWATSTDQKATFAPDPTILLRKMAVYNSFVAQTTPYNESPVTAVFDTTGIRQAIAPVNEVCGWTLD